MKAKEKPGLIILTSKGISPRDFPENEFKWAYIGEDFIEFQTIQSMIPENGLMIDFERILRKNVHLLRKPYIDYIGTLSLKNHSLHWWAGALSEKNPFISKTFFYSCQIKTCLDILEKEGDGLDIFFFIEKKCLREALLVNINSLRGQNVITRERFWQGVADSIKNIKTFITKKGHFKLSNIYRIFLSKYIYRSRKEITKNDEKENIFLFTWITRPPFEGKSYKDSFYGNLTEIARVKYPYKRVSIVPYTLGTISYKENLKKIRESDENFIEPWSFLTIGDILGSLLTSIRNRPKGLQYPKFQGMDISPIIYHDLKQEWLDKRLPTDLLFHRLVERWKKQGYGIDRFIYLFENHTWEKMFISAFRKYYPDTVLIGYQHSTIPENMLNHFFSENELGITPLPDRIITNGEYSTKLLEKYGYPESILKKGGAIRFSGLFEQEMKIVPGINNKRPGLLVTPPIGMLESIELIKKIHDAFASIEDYDIIIKCHPAMPFKYFSHLLDFQMPGHFSISDKNLDDLLKEVDILFYTSSTTCIEALAIGVQVVHINSGYSLEMDPLDFAKDSRFEAGTPQEIRKAVEEIHEMPEELERERRARGIETVKYLFTPVNDETYELFLGK